MCALRLSAHASVHTIISVELSGFSVIHIRYVYVNENESELRTNENVRMKRHNILLIVIAYLNR